MIRFNDVTFRGLEINAAIQEGDTVFITGQMGAGKSSLLALSTGMLMPDSGDVQFDRGYPPSFVLVSQSEPVPEGSLLEIMVGEALLRRSNEDIGAIMARFGLTPLLERIGGLDGEILHGGRSLSSGERLRLHLCRAALITPDLTLIDAAEGPADPATSCLIWELVADNPGTILMTTFERQPWSWPHRNWHIEQGQIVESVIVPMADWRSRAPARRRQAFSSNGLPPKLTLTP